MAATVDISPNVGHGVVCTQLGVGASPGYDAIDFRRLAQAGWQEGVNSATSWSVAAVSPAGMGVSVAANQGMATIQGDSVSNQARYVVAPHGGVITLDLATAHATNPRIDSIILQVYDDSHDSSGYNKATCIALTGTATAGATLNNRTGAPGLPSNAMLLADILVPANSTTVTAANIRDRRRWQNGANWVGSSTNGNVLSSVLTMSAIDLTSLQCRLEIQSNPVRVVLTANTTQGSAAPGVVGFWIDGALPPAWPGSYVYNAQGLNSDASFSYVFVPTAGSHLFTATFASTTAGIDFGIQAASYSACRFAVEEISDFSKANGTT